MPLVNLFDRASQATRKRLFKAMWIVWGLALLCLGLAGLLQAPEWLESGIILAFPVSWIIVALAIKIRAKD
jgi:hypothetical protein